MKQLILGELKFIVLKLKISFHLVIFKKLWKNKCVQNVKDVKPFYKQKVKKTAAILTAQGEKEATILQAEAEKEAKISKAKGEAEALRLVYEAQAKGIQYINDSNPQEAYLKLQGFKALEKLADGQSTKIIVPSEIQGLAGLISSIKEVATDDNE